MACSYVGSRPFHHDAPERAKDIEDEYDRLRDLARKERTKRQDCFDRAHEAYESGDGARAHELSEEGKRHGAKMDDYNRQASEFIFRENNAEGRVAADEIDLHGQFTEEAEDILEERIRYAQQHGQTHLHVIVGKGNHSTNHIQKLKPRCEQVCRDLGLQFRTEDNAGRMYVDLTGGEAHLPEHLGGGGQRPESKVRISEGRVWGKPQQQQPQSVHHQNPSGGSQHHAQGSWAGVAAGEQQHEPKPAEQKPHHAHGHSYADAVSGDAHGKPEQQQQQQGNYQQQYGQPYYGGQQQQQQQGQNNDVDEMLRKGKRLLRAFKSCCVVM